MAEEGFKELIKQTKETNDLLRKQAAAEGKPDPVKFVKEEIVAILAERKYHKECITTQTKFAKEDDLDVIKEKSEDEKTESETVSEENEK